MTPTKCGSMLVNLAVVLFSLKGKAMYAPPVSSSTIRQAQRMNDDIYSNDLHEALLKKNNTTFWKCWRSKFDSTNKCTQVDGCVDANIILAIFVPTLKILLRAIIPKRLNH